MKSKPLQPPYREFGGKNLPIRSNDDGEREAERDDLLFVVGAEGPNSADGQLVDRGHLLGVLSAPPTLVAKSVI